MVATKMSQPMSTSPIQKEVDFFERHRAELLAQAEGKFVLIKDETVIGIYPSRREALDVGYDQFGPEPFLVHEISKVDETLNFAMFAFP